MHAIECYGAVDHHALHMIGLYAEAVASQLQQ